MASEDKSTLSEENGLVGRAGTCTHSPRIFIEFFIKLQLGKYRLMFNSISHPVKCV